MMVMFSIEVGYAGATLDRILKEEIVEWSWKKATIW